MLCCAVLCCAVRHGAVLSVLCCCPRAVLCCAYHAIVHAGKELENQLPSHAYTNNYAPDFRLHIPVRTGKENLNTPERIAMLRDELLQNISRSATARHIHCFEVRACFATEQICLDLGGDNCPAAVLFGWIWGQLAERVNACKAGYMSQ